MELFKANEELRIENAERKRVQAELKTRAKQQAAVAELGQQALAGNQVSHLMNQAVAQIAQILNVEYCKVLELLPDRNAVLLRAGVGWKDGLVGHATVSVGLDSQAGYTLLSSEPVIVEDLRREVRFNGPSLLHEHGIVSGLSVIIPGQNHPYGVLGAHTTRQRKFTKDDVHFLQATANVLASAINRQQAEAALRRAHNDLEIRVQERTQDLAKANLELQQKIIEHQQAEEERAKLIAILEASPDIVASVSVDEQCSYGAARLTHYLNSAARNLFGLGENQDCTNFTISKAYPEWAYQLVHNEGIPAAIREGVWVGETAFLNPDGREIPVSQLLIAHKSPDGRVKLISTVARDITQQKKIAATLLESERRWRSLLENVRLVVVGLNHKGKVEYVNPCFLELVGYTKEEVIGQDWVETFLPSHQRHSGQNNFIGLLEQEFFYSHTQNVVLTRSGEERVIAWNNTLLQDLQGYVVGTLSIGEDITERQVIERMKDEFISVVSHELRTPLTSIHGALNLLSSGLVNTQSEKGRRVIEIAAESAERLVRLVNDILELERLESGKISLSKQHCNAADLMRQATEMIQVMANRAGITLSIASHPIQLEADPDRIIQVLTNLLGNAIKFSSQGSTVWLTIELQEASESGCPVQHLAHSQRENGSILPSPSLALSPPQPSSPAKPKQILFQVKDQGRGIPADKLESIFERFHQVDASDSRKKGGTGLGLAICRSIVQQHGGRIWVESTLGEGSSFYFTLPG
jgi:PAS domain S-box-containing protein